MVGSVRPLPPAVEALSPIFLVYFISKGPHGAQVGEREKEA